MRARALFTVPALFTIMGLLGTCNGATIAWGTGEAGPGTGGAVDYYGSYLSGTRASGPVNLSNGALVQLIKAVGAIDDPRGNMAFLEDPNFTVDDVILDEVHVGYGVGPPGAAAKGEWSRTVEVGIEVGDVLYVRAYNVPKPAIGTIPVAQLGIGIRNTSSDIVSHAVMQVTNPERYYFDNLQTEGGEPIPQHTLTMAVSPAGAGTVTPSAGDHVYNEGSTVNINATGNTGWVFDHWDGPVDGSSTQKANQVTMDTDKIVTAIFVEEAQVSLTMDVSPAGAGMTTPAIGSHSYPVNTVVTIDATGNTGWLFDHWEGPVDGDPKQKGNQVTMDARKSITAVFVSERKVTLTLGVKPSRVVFGEAVSIYGSLTDSRGKGLAGRAVQTSVSPPQGTPEVIVLGTDANGNYASPFTAASAGTGWSVVAWWLGDESHDGATATPASFNVLPASTKLGIVSSAYVVFSSGTVDLTERLEATTRLPAESDLLGGQGISLHRIDPAGQTRTPLSATTDASGGCAFQNLVLGDVGLWRIWAEFHGSPDLQPSSSKEIQVEVKEMAGYAILVSGKGKDDSRLESHNRTTDMIYHTLQERSFAQENIFYLRFGTPDDASIEVDGLPSVGAIKSAITTWAKDQMITAPGPLFIVFIGSAKTWQFYVSGDPESMTPRDLDYWITSLEASLDGSPAEGQNITFIYGAPYSGSFIEWLSRKETRRVLVTSCDPNELPVTGPQEDAVPRQGDFFVLKLFENLARGGDLNRSFQEAKDATRTYTLNKNGNGIAGGFVYPDLSAQHPLLDDNGDGIGSFGLLSRRPGDDGSPSAHTFLGFGEAGPEAQIAEVAPKQVISPGERPNLWAKVNDRNRVESLWMLIQPPFFSMGMVAGDLSAHRDVEAAQVTLFDPDEDGVYSPTTYPGFPQRGTYRVLFFVKDKQTGRLGEIRSMKVVVFDPEPPDPGAFSMLLPEDGATVGMEVLLRWSESQEGRPGNTITYRVEIATDPAFDDVVFERGDIEGTSLLVGEDAGLLDRATYYWRVMAESFFGKIRFAQRAEMKSTDIGQPQPGSTQYDGLTDTYTILGNGGGFFGSEDQFRFVHTSAGGSFELWTRLDSLEETGSPSLAGIMIRESTDPDSPYAMVGITVGDAVVSAMRGVPGSSAWTDEYGTTALPQYLKMICLRSSPEQPAEITPYFSPDGDTWYPGTTLQLVFPKDVQVGICVASGDEQHLVQAVFGEFTVSPLGGGPSAPGSSPFAAAPPVKAVGTDYSTFNTNEGAGLPAYNVLTVLVYNQNDPSQSPPGSTIAISPIVGTVTNWMYSGYLPVGPYTVDASAPHLSPEHRPTEVTTESPVTEVFLLTPNPNSVSGKVVSAGDFGAIRGAAVQLEITSGIYTGTTYDANSDGNGRFRFIDLPSAIDYRISISKPHYNDYQASFTLDAGEARNLGTISLDFTNVDGDNLPDGWEQQIVDADPDDDIRSVADVVPDDDFDGDGRTNRDEYLAGTDPTSALSSLKSVRVVRDTSGALTITWTSVEGMLYRVYYSDAIGTWSLAASDIPASETGQNSWTDDDTSGSLPPPSDVSVRFYRVEAY